MENIFTSQEKVYALQRMLEKHYTFVEVRRMLLELIFKILDDKINIKDIKQTQKGSGDGGENILTFYLSDGSTYNYVVKNGTKGDKGLSDTEYAELMKAVSDVTSSISKADLAAVYAKQQGEYAQGQADSAKQQAAAALSAASSASEAGRQAMLKSQDAHNAAEAANAAAIEAAQKGNYAVSAGSHADIAANEAGKATQNASNAAYYAKQQGDYAKSAIDNLPKNVADKEYVSDQIKNKIDEAPKDGTQYIRQDGQWVEVEISKDVVKTIDLTNYVNGEIIDGSQPFICCMLDSTEVILASHYRISPWEGIRIDCFFHISVEVDNGANGITGHTGLVYTILVHVDGGWQYVGNLITINETLNDPQDNEVDVLYDRNYDEWVHMIDLLFAEGTKDYNELHNKPFEWDNTTVEHPIVDGETVTIKRITIPEDTQYVDLRDPNKVVFSEEGQSLTEILDEKIDKVDGMGLSTNDYTDADAHNVRVNIPALSSSVSALNGKVGTLTSNVNDLITNKLDNISDLDAIRSGASAGATAVQPTDIEDYVTSENLATVKKEVTEIANGQTAIAFKAGDNISKIMLDFLATINPPYQQRFFATNDTITKTLTGIPENQTRGFLIVLTCLGSVSAPGSPSKPNYNRSAIVELYNASYSGEISSGINYYFQLGRLANGTATKPTVYPTIPWQKVYSDQFAYSKTEVNDLLNNKQDRLTAGENVKIENGVISVHIENGNEEEY